MHTPIRFIAAALVFTAGCDTTTVDTSAPLVVPEPFSACQASDGEDYSYGGFDTGSASFASVDGDTLSLDVGYGGGCEEHEWVLCWPEQSFLEEEPAQARLELWHGIDSNVVCDAYLTETLTFDLAPLREQYRAGYSSDSGTITLSIGDAAVTYTF